MKLGIFRMGARFFAAILVLGVAVGAQPPSATDDARAQRIISSPAFKAAVAVFERDFDRFVDEIVLLTEIPAPPFGEKARGEAYLKMLRATGLEQCETDAAGNVMGLRRGRGRAPLLAVAAHLDTVFRPEPT